MKMHGDECSGRPAPVLCTRPPSIVHKKPLCPTPIGPSATEEGRSPKGDYAPARNDRGGAKRRVGAPRGGAKRRPRQGGVPKSAAKGIIEAWILHLASLQRRSPILREDCYNVVT